MNSNRQLVLRTAGQNGGLPKSANEHASPKANQTANLRDALFNKAGILIEQLDHITDICKGIKLDFPQIIVIGEEASGKSSVLERIAMLQFFPRSRETAICTRMPINLRLKHLSVEEMKAFCATEKVPYFDGCAYVRLCYEEDATSNMVRSAFFHPSEVEAQIQIHMKEAVKTKKGGAVMGVVDDKMIVEVHSNMVPNLSLVDLPGIVGARMEGEPEDMMQQTRKLAEKNLKNPHTLVLAIFQPFKEFETVKECN